MNFKVQIMSNNKPYFLLDILSTNPFRYTLTRDSDKALKLDQNTAWKSVRNIAIEFILHSLAENMSFFIIDDNGKTQYINVKDLIHEMLKSGDYQIVKVG